MGPRLNRLYVVKSAVVLLNLYTLFCIELQRSAYRNFIGRTSTLSTATIDSRRGGCMLWTIFVVLLVLWLLGLVSSYTLGGFIHILLVLAVIVLVINLLSGRRTAL
jgi:hypothetical protein